MLWCATVFIWLVSVDASFVSMTQSEHVGRNISSDLNYLQDIPGAESIALALNLTSSLPPLDEVGLKWGILQNAALASLPSSPREVFEKLPIKVLIVVSADDAPEMAERQEKNINILTKQKHQVDTIKWAIFNYNGTDNAFKTKTWYNDPNIVIHHELREGCKPEMYAGLRSHLTKQFDYIWLMDEDIDLTYVGWPLLRRLLVTTQALVSQPSVVPRANGERGTDVTELNFRDFSDEIVLAREEKRTEVMTPVLSSKIWPAVLKRLEGNVDVNVCETDRFWDLAAYLGKIHGCGRSGPVVFNTNPIVHVDARTLPKDGKCEGFDDCESENRRPVSDEEAALLRNVCPGIPGDWLDRYGCRDADLGDCTGALREAAGDWEPNYKVNARVEELLKYEQGVRVGLVQV
jgi:hypothetical protein|eukprot:TRINITY_DN5674_c0_g1_i2.p1 TRINITY_DN5674_c0_g1~~TRINITY_DN5674_c0_g1_i2.p1  ORF type:complete len:424 (-),score=59.33 TRINITY_DN5674_c0_g1_i2:64-1278(-)